MPTPVEPVRVRIFKHCLNLCRSNFCKYSRIHTQVRVIIMLKLELYHIFSFTASYSAVRNYKCVSSILCFHENHCEGFQVFTESL